MDHECELVDVEMTQNSAQAKSRGLLRITVDSPSGDGRVPIERCVAISREVETLLDAGDAIPGAYQLEVSSPGLDRVLGREKDFIAAIDQVVKLRTSRPIEGRKRFRGRLISVEAEQAEEAGLGETETEHGADTANEETEPEGPRAEEGATSISTSTSGATSNASARKILKLMIDGEVARVPLDDVEKANSIYEFTSADFSHADSAKAKPGQRARRPKSQARKSGKKNGKKSKPGHSNQPR